ncbi:type II secretion system F family protein [Asticcacaulis sp. EMRT-3]|uniref:type II secretion system F family protein n=1 Tax=Asticcacaulis sp. EMRT-3 TaxID=3040349 RepID=UPI0024AF8322|nr:type II secretion system F family protein [Asticcacaulis sp. EMRT-3]MDI7776016.1 type II secretion system F family protein [Asticcacaulis sp. EMRT-3]
MLTTLLIAFLSFVLLASLGFAITGGGGSAQLTKRTQAIGLGTNAAVKRKSGGQARTPEERRRQITEQLKEAEQRERKARLSLSARMQHAGLEANISRFWIISGVLGAMAFLLPLLLLGNVPFALRLLIAAGAAFAACYGLPRWILSFMAKRRVARFTEEFPNAMDIIVRGIKSGLPVNDGLKLAAKECTAPLGPEFQRLVENVAIGMSLENALDKMSEHIPAPELRFFAIVIAIQQKSGGNLSEALNNLSSVLRARKMMREKIKALSSEAIASASIIGVLPPGVGLMIFITRPDYIAIMFTNVVGNLMLLGGAVWMGLGILMMRKMINFKF